jgi:integrase/recombinase XerD
VDESIREFEKYVWRRFPDRSTVKHYVNDLKLFARFVNNKPAAEVCRMDIDRFIEEQLTQGLAATTINRRLASLHHFFEFVADQAGEQASPNPVAWQRHRAKEGNPLPRDVSDGTIEQLFACIDAPRDRLMFGLMCWLGLRVGEVVNLTVSDLIRGDPSSSTMRLRVRGKGQKERFVPMTGKLVAQWDEWLAQRPEEPTTALFVTRRHTGITVRGVQDRLRHYCQQAGVQLSCHQLRHTFGRWMAENEMPLPSLSKLLGHAHVSTTQVYISGAAVEVRAHYEAAMTCLEAQALSTADVRSAPSAWVSAGAEEQKRPSIPEKEVPLLDLSEFWGDLPSWLTERLDDFLAHQQRRWKPSQRHHHARARSKALRQIWIWLVTERSVNGWGALTRQDIQAYAEVRLSAGVAASTINRQLRDLWSFLHFVEDEVPISPGVFRVERLKEAKPLPRFLDEGDYQRVERQILDDTRDGSRDDLLDRAWFYLLAHTGVRLGELRELRLGDLDLAGRRLTVRQGKGLRDRVVPLSGTVCQALNDYLQVRGEAETDHLLVLRQEPLKATLVPFRLGRYGDTVGVDVSPHRLRHTLATRLVNAGMDIVSIQRLLGHEKLDTTMIYSHVHDETMERDFRQAMNRLAAGQEPPGTEIDSLADVLFSHARVSASQLTQVPNRV